MYSALLFVSVPVRLPGSGCCADQIDSLNVCVYDNKCVREVFVDSHDRRRSAFGAWKCFVVLPERVIARQFLVNRGESVHFRFRYDPFHKPGKNPEYFSQTGNRRSRYDLSPIPYFATTIPRADFLSQGDLLSFLVRGIFTFFRREFQSLKSSVVQRAQVMSPSHGSSVQSPLDRLMGKEIETCLCDLYSEVYRSVYLFSRLQSCEATYQPADIQAAVAFCQAPVIPLLDRLLVIINECGGVVTEKGLACLIIDPNEQIPEICFHDDDSTTVTTGDFEPVSCNQCSQLRYQWMVMGIKFVAALSREVLQPLLKIFHPSQLSNEALRKIFCASEYFIEHLMASES